jgi:rhamnulokinase
MKTYHFLAFDVGATSGRAMLATVTNDSFDLKEIHRFPNAIMGIHGRYYWNVYSLYDNLKKSIAVARDMDIKLDSIGIDTWGCDFGYIAEDGTLLGLPRAYRDQYTKDAPEHAYELVPRDELYAHTGIQILPFNSIFQIFQARADKFAPALHASKILFIPDLLSYFCTGKMFTEYTVASTSGMLNATTRTWDEEILTKLGIPSSMLLPLTQPGTVVGTLLPEIAEELGVDQIPVVAVAGHDTAAAVTAVPAADKNFAYLSSGTWSLMGIETDKPILTEQSSKLNYTNEGGIEGTTRFLKNITGMWLLEQSRKCWSRFGRNYTYAEIEAMAGSEKYFPSIINPDDPRFANPEDMDEEIKKACRESGQKAPETDAQTISCIYHSLAHRYTEVIAALQDMASFDIDKLHVIGGGSVNKVMSQLTADTIQMPVIAGPSEATAIGNAMIQAKAAGLYSDRWDMRRAVASNIGTKTYYPQK